jgi:UDP-N-acetylglucosamine 2-epimerase (non-hydrolysing)
MKIMTILGTRPEIIRLSRIIPLLDDLCDHIVVHTGQNFDRNLNDIFFTELKLRTPDFLLDSQAPTLMAQIGEILSRCERVMLTEKPDRLLILGDTNSALAAMVAKRLRIPVYHMEAGNRCYDDRVPEEINRRVVDHCSDIRNVAGLIYFVKVLKGNVFMSQVIRSGKFLTIIQTGLNKAKSCKS